MNSLIGSQRFTCYKALVHLPKLIKSPPWTRYINRSRRENRLSHGFNDNLPNIVRKQKLKWYKHITKPDECEKAGYLTWRQEEKQKKRIMEKAASKRGLIWISVNVTELQRMVADEDSKFILNHYRYASDTALRYAISKRTSYKCEYIYLHLNRFNWLNNLWNYMTIEFLEMSLWKQFVFGWTVCKFLV